MLLRTWRCFTMMNVPMIALAFSLFALAVAYACACERG
jgi:hypothetical protein